MTESDPLTFSLANISADSEGKTSPLVMATMTFTMDSKFIHQKTLKTPKEPIQQDNIPALSTRTNSSDNTTVDNQNIKASLTNSNSQNPSKEIRTAQPFTPSIRYDKHYNRAYINSQTNCHYLKKNLSQQSSSKIVLRST